jgi:hypothetical protein
MADVLSSFDGSLIGLALNTPAAIEWGAEHLPDDAPRLGNIVYVECRYAEDIVLGMREDGLDVV